MADVAITKKPSLSVSYLSAPARYSSGASTRRMKATWKVPKALVSGKKNDRAEEFDVTWTLDLSGVSAKKDPRQVKEITNTNRTESAINLDNFKVGSRTYTRSSFYPINTDRKLKSVSVRVVPHNKKGDGTPVTMTREFEKPLAPTISVPTFNAESGTVSATITTSAGTGYHERYDTKYKVWVYDSRTKKNKAVIDSSSTNTSISVSHDVGDYMSMSYGHYVSVTIRAWARGYAGVSEMAERVFYVSYPRKVNITDVQVDRTDSRGKATVYVDTNNKDKNAEEHPIDRVVLEYLANVPYSRASAIPGDESWMTTDIKDDAQCKALAMPVSELIPDAGNYTWLRVRSHHAAENVLYRYSNYWNVTQLHTTAPTAADEAITILSVTAGTESAVVHLGWNKNGTDDATGTELSWADAEDAWRSTKAPTIHEFEWSDGPVTVGSVTYRDSARITIKDLKAGERYYIKARRYLDGETTTYSPYSNTKDVQISEEPEETETPAVVARASGYIASDEPLQVYWSYSGANMQRSWKIVSSTTGYGYEQVIGVSGDPSAQNYYELVGGQYTLTADTEVDEEKTYYRLEKYGTVIESGEGSLGSTQISAERLASFAVNGSVTFTVQVSAGGSDVISEEHTVTIIDKPVISLNVGAVLEAQPLEFGVTSDKASDLILVVTSQGTTGQFPEGIRTQTAGDTVYSDVLSPVWTESSGAFNTTVELPEGLDFWDGCGYEVSVIAVDRSTALRSEEVRVPFSIEWSTQAKDPVAALLPMDYIDVNNVHHLAVQISLTAPTGSASTDVYDIYRMDGGKASLIGRNFPLTHTAVDEYAPYGDGNLYYRVALRTVDGDVAFDDIGYILDSNVMRFDWQDGPLELPYGLSISEGYKKDVEFRSHMDGSIDGYWRQNIERKASLHSSVIKLIQPDEIELARNLARHTGAVFVRLPNGSAFEADVQITDLSVKNEAITAIAIDATEIGLTQAFALPIPNVLEEE